MSRWGALALLGLCLGRTVHGADAPAEWHTSAGGTVNGLAVIDTGGGPEQRPAADASLHLDAAVAHLAARLELRGRIGGPFVGGAGAGVYDFDHAFQNQSPALEFPEAWIEARLPRIEIRAGLQRFAWGKLDGLPPTDILNPRDYHDPIVADFEQRKIGVPALATTYYPSVVPIPGMHDVKLSAVWIPFATPPRLALERERWFPRSTRLPSRIALAPGLLDELGLCPAYCQTPQAIAPVALETANRTPPRRFDSGGVALRLAGAFRETDWDLYHYTGPETGPLAELHPTLFVRPGATFPNPTTLPLGAVSRLLQAHREIHMTGGDLATAFGGLTVRTEVAYFADRPYLRVAGDLLSRRALARLDAVRVFRALTRRGLAPIGLGELFPTHDAIEWGVGADYLWSGWLPLLQINQTVLLDDAPERLVIADPETRVTGSLKKRFFDDRVDLDLRAAYGIERGWWFIMPRVGYRLRDDVHLRAGYLAIGGPQASYLGQFNKNDEVLLQLQYSY